MGSFNSSTAIDYGNKLSLIRSYMGYFTDAEITSLFSNRTVSQILSQCSYQYIKATLKNALSISEEQDLDIGDIVTINKPILLDGEYKLIRGLIIGIHTVYDYKDSNNHNSIYHSVYDVLILTNNYQDDYPLRGYAYDVRRYQASDLLVTDDSIPDTEDFLQQFSSMLIENPV